MNSSFVTSGPGLTRMWTILSLWLVKTSCATCVRKQPTIALYFEPENVLKLYNLEAKTIVTNAYITLWQAWLNETLELHCKILLIVLAY